MHRLYLIISAVLLLPLTMRAQLSNDEACGAIPMGRLELGNTLTLENATNIGAEGNEVGWYNEQANFYSCRGTDSWNNTVYYRFELDEAITGVRVTITPRTASARLNAVLLAARKCEDIQFRDIERVSWSPDPGNACATQPGEAITIEDDCLIRPGGNTIESVHRVFGSTVYISIASDTDGEEGDFNILVEPIEPTYCDACWNGAETEIDGPPLPLSLTASGPTALCPGESVVLSVPHVAGAFYWTNQDTGEEIVRTESSFTVTEPGTYQVAVKTNCIPYQSNTVRVSVATPLSAFRLQVQSSPNLCQGDSVLLSAPLQTGLVYQWYQDGQPLSNNAGVANERWIKQSGVYMLTIGNSCQRVTTEPVSITVNERPVAPSVKGEAVCAGGTVTLSASSPLATAYHWYTEAGDLLPNQAAELTLENLTSDERYWVAAVMGTCESKAVEVVAQAYPVPPASITTDTTLIALGTSLTLNAPPDPSYRYRWTPSESLNNDTLASPVATPEDNTTYTLTITTPEGCSSSASVEIIVQKVLLIPNTFTPNGDGVNDTWIVTNLERFPNSTLRIFDRWGQVLLEATDYDQSWQGRFQGKDLPEDTYFYFIDKGNGDPPRRGSLTIIR